MILEMIAEQNLYPEAKYDLLKQVLNSSQDYIWAVDLDYNLIECNASFTNFFSNVKDVKNVFVGDNISLLDFGENLQDWREFYDLAFAGKKLCFEKHFAPVFLECCISPLTAKDGSIVGATVFARDITARKLHENEYLKKTKELMEANSTKDKFFSIIAHDLKNPLATFKQVTEILYDDLDQMTYDDIKEYITDLKNSALHSLNLLENLLEWSSIQRGKMIFNPQEIHLSMIVNNIVLLTQMKAMQKDILLTSEIDESKRIFADPNMVLTIIRNLVSNSLKFTPKNGLITIGSKIEDDKAIIWVKDTGIGIKEEDIAKLFRLDVHHSTIGTSSEEGTGLGLILCKEFVEMNGGKIWVESEFGKYTTFFFTLPIIPN